MRNIKQQECHMRIYVGNLAYTSTDRDLEALFTPYGDVESAQIIMDRDAGRSRWFGFVEMGAKAEAEAAIAGLNGKEMDSQTLTVNEARPRAERPARDRGFSNRW
jgi:cold-inducible RNA-binding protein